MTYHAMEQVDVSVDVAGPSPAITTRTWTEATIWDGHGTWPLQLRVQFIYDGATWLASNTVASTWR
jgi:hypothetical protein